MIAKLIAVYFLLSNASASTVLIYVSDGKVKDCPPATTLPEELRYVLKPDAASAALKKYVAGKKNPEQYDAAFVNAGLRFCGTEVAMKVFGALLDTLKPAEPPQRAWELVKNYKADPSLLDAIELKLKDKKLSATHQQNLVNARGMTVPKGFDPRKIKYH